eukprot:TRINITY_DN18826_c0_g1_i1.p1 TRINITY_DN18826_c0_g1~~TRINITY_DN18826_c0_g1_i1.p1  ORF type:complete len:211 (-),score=65.25 TRINITY_DN18826_c0_g1_i1:72-704(-)
MKVVIFNGSAHPKGNSAIMCEWVTEELSKEGIEVEMITIGGKVALSCSGCGACTGKNACVKPQDGGWINAAFQKMLEADGILLASPTHFSDVSVEMKSLIDRCGMMNLNNGHPLRHKIGAAVTSVRRGGAVCTFDTMNHWFFINEMIVVGSTYWNMGVGLKQGEVRADKEAEINMRNLGQNMAYVLKSLAAGKAAGVKEPAVPDVPNRER